MMKVIMTKSRTTITGESDVLRAVKVRAVRTGKSESQVIKEALRRYLGLDLLDKIWAKGTMNEDEAMALALEAQHLSRKGSY